MAGCWENIIIPIYVLNGEKLDGRFKVLSNAEAKDYHFVIYDKDTLTIYDPTYEKRLDLQSRGTERTKPMLGNACYFFDLGYYLREFELQGNGAFTSQLREYGGRFLDAVAVAPTQ